VVRGDEVHGSRLTESTLILREGVADAEALGRRARRRVVLTVDDVADPPDRESKCEPGRCGAGAEADRHPAPDRRDVSTQDAADRGPPDRDAAGPEEEDLLGMRDVLGKLVDDVDETRADEPADHAPRSEEHTSELQSR